MFEGELLDETHDPEGFACGIAELDTWLRSWALSSQRRGTARTFVWHGASDRAVVAYFSLAPTVITRDSLPRKLGRGDRTSIPAILLARLALDQSLQGQDLGAELLYRALERAVAASEVVGGRYVVIDAINEAAMAFYEHFGFQRAPSLALQSLRLVRKVSDIAASMGQRP